ncbi:MAG: hypothetical protein O2791_05000, partial [Bacteroidetes bacterium]|nr:hypothetical protein [Bacteroidota bacterium]
MAYEGRMCRYLRTTAMVASSSQIQVRVLPEVLKNPEALREAVMRQLAREGRSALPMEARLEVLRHSWDARKSPVMAQVV